MDKIVIGMISFILLSLLFGYVGSECNMSESFSRLLLFLSIMFGCIGLIVSAVWVANIMSDAEKDRFKKYHDS